MNRFLHFGLVLSLLGAGSWLACVNPFAPAVTSEPVQSSSLLTNQESPEDVLINFRYAYTFKDSLVYSEILDSTFIFRSWDFNVSPPVPLQWGRDTELRITGRMFRFFNTLDLVWNETAVVDTLPDGIEMKRTFTLTLDGGRSIPTLNGEVRFRFVRRGKKWFIALWEDQII